MATSKPNAKDAAAQATVEITPANQAAVNIVIGPLTAQYMNRQPGTHQLTSEDCELIINNAVTLANAIVAATKS